MSDQLTASERIGACDCLVEMTCEWLTRSLAGQTEEQRGLAIQEVCLWVSQMRHRPPSTMAMERRRWLGRIVLRLCASTPGAAGYESVILGNLDARTTVELMAFHDWREKHAPFVEGRLNR